MLDNPSSNCCNTVNTNANLVPNVPANGPKFTPDNIIQLVGYALGFGALSVAAYGIYKGNSITITKGDISVQIGPNNKPEEKAS